MKRIDSDALGVVTDALGLTGSGSQNTELMDASVEQTLDVGALVRRGRTPAATGGLFRGVLANAHGAAETLSSVWQPYDGLATTAVAPYVLPLPKNLDVYLFSAAVRRTSGTGTLAATLELIATRQGFGVDDGGVFIADNGPIPLAIWDGLVTIGTQTIATTGAEDLTPWKRIGIRIPRARISITNLVGIRFTSVSSAIAEYRCQLLFGIFPVALGQDGIF